MLRADVDDELRTFRLQALGYLGELAERSLQVFGDLMSQHVRRRRFSESSSESSLSQITSRLTLSLCMSSSYAKGRNRSLSSRSWRFSGLYARTKSSRSS